MQTNEQLIQDIARPLYQDHGPNQWPHIQRVINSAKDISARTSQPLTNEALAALYLHDAAKAHMEEYPGVEDHGVASSILARKVLKGKMPQHSIATIANAIAEHNMDVKPRSKVSDILMSADTNLPDLDFIIRKSYMWSKRNKLNNKDLLNNVYNAAVNKSVASGRKIIPPMFAKAYPKEIDAIRGRVAALRREDIKQLIKKALAKYRHLDQFA